MSRLTFDRHPMFWNNDSEWKKLRIYSDQKAVIVDALMKTIPQDDYIGQMVEAVKKLEAHLLSGLRYNPKFEKQFAKAKAEGVKDYVDAGVWGAYHDTGPDRLVKKGSKILYDILYILRYNDPDFKMEGIFILRNKPINELISFSKSKRFTEKHEKLVDDVIRLFEQRNADQDLWYKKRANTFDIMDQYENLEDLLKAIPALEPFATECKRHSEEKDNHKIKEMWGL